MKSPGCPRNCKWCRRASKDHWTCQAIGSREGDATDFKPRARRPACRRRPSIGRGVPSEREFPRGDRCMGRDAFEVAARAVCNFRGAFCVHRPSASRARPVFVCALSLLALACCCIRRRMRPMRTSSRTSSSPPIASSSRIIAGRRLRHRDRRRAGAAPSQKTDGVRSARDDARRHRHAQRRPRRHDIAAHSRRGDPTRPSCSSTA